MVYVELPEVGSTVKKSETFGVVESVKAASDVYSPVSGEVVAVNDSLSDEPGKVSAAPAHFVSASPRTLASIRGQRRNTPGGCINPPCVPLLAAVSVHSLTVAGRRMRR